MVGEYRIHHLDSHISKSPPTAFVSWWKIICIASPGDATVTTYFPTLYAHDQTSCVILKHVEPLWPDDTTRCSPFVA